MAAVELLRDMLAAVRPVLTSGAMNAAQLAGRTLADVLAGWPDGAWLDAAKLGVGLTARQIGDRTADALRALPAMSTGDSE